MKTRTLHHLFIASVFCTQGYPLPGRQEADTASGNTDRDSIVAAQVALDRAGFSPGEIDGQGGDNFQHVLAAFQEVSGLSATGQLDEKTSAALLSAGGSDAPLADYVITEEDAAGPFTGPIPEKIEDKAKLANLGYANVSEMLGERFHIEPELLDKLNSKSGFAAGDTIRVPNIEPIEMPSVPSSKEFAKDKQGNGNKSVKAPGSAELSTSSSRRVKGPLTITVSKGKSTLVVTDSTSAPIFVAPVTTGSEHDPLPIGDWKVTGVERNPSFNYNPDLFWDAKSTDKKAKLPAGPNNPVGLAWIDITKPHYGIHGTPEPGKVGHSESHGCVRLTNWDVLRLAQIVKAGTKVEFTE